MSVPDDELWSVAQVAEFLGCSESRARADLAKHGIKRISGYPAALVKSIVKRQGARTDLPAGTTTHDDSAPFGFGPIQFRAITALRDGLTHTLHEVAFEPRLGRVDQGMQVLMQSGLDHLVRRGYATKVDANRWRITESGRQALETIDAANR
ncbi:hypothetical protein [Mycobacteroides abscessus]|uniref:hypothetical protein n=1 Tax=Mycobacteroides abscessus TaxID=36809 RepID=UPI00092B3931|nr:hypothetical protein [Mycobacteroides abscessus]SHQ46208.1 Uncharacterised protein [Mycobacteroides abscessus subsp. abscessus]SKQ86991.1 Uncharacterised protein [Mycobacteroides abscessus subsp. massiliense]SLC47649.1 Uncharacterised protein [Mycobacteroides abscessus subsp. massiliense]